ncbi:MAG: nickel-dependent lactate racemase [Rhodospirillales bacterium]|nr:nickel-dependent lactate racemase [Rhodospirillales bacterium]
MAQVSIPFDGKPYTFEVADENLIEVLSPVESQPVDDLDTEIERALKNPIGQAQLGEWVKPTDTVLLVSDDNTRLTPSDRIVPPMLDLLNAAGVKDEQITCMIALGTHRYMTEPELREKMGAAVCDRIRVVNHEWKDPDQLVDLGVSEHGTPLVVNKAAVEADVVIGIGAVVPHHIPGFSGSSKIIQPGICGFDTTAETHLLSCSAGDSFLGVESNPVRDDLDSMADKVGMDTIFNVVMNSDGGVVGAFYGEKRATFKGAVKLATDIYGIDYHETPDIVVANSCPCDLDFWQSHKSQYPAQRMIKKGGTIIVCTPAPEGISPVHTDLLEFTSWPAEKMEKAYRSGELKDGVATALAIAWALVREHANVITYSPGIPADHKEALGHTHAPSIEWALEEALRRQGAGARVTVLTHAADMLPLKAF